MFNFKIVPTLGLFIAIAAVGIFILPKMINNHGGANNSSTFKIVGDKKDAEACYISVIYLEGYSYTPTEWFSYNQTSINENLDIILGEKIGEVTIDLKGLKYTGTPPDFSSTLDVGTEIYEIKNMNKERAVFVKNNNLEFIFYRDRKVISSEKEALNLKIAEVFSMITDTTIVEAVELRSEEDGSWMRTSENEKLSSLINQELPQIDLINSLEIGKESNSQRVPINLIFEDGTKLHMQVYPEDKFAYIFGGYIPISDELAIEINTLYHEGDEYPRITDLVSYKQEELNYLYIQNHVDGSEILCKEPLWSGGAFYSLLNYYRVTLTQQDKTDILVMSIVLGKSKEDSTLIEFYERRDNVLILRVNGEFYEIVKGDIKYLDLIDYLNNYTELGTEVK